MGLADKIFRLIEEVSSRAEVRTNTTAVNNIVSFYGVKGGMGVSTLVSNLAITIASQGKSVIVIDFDLHYPCQYRFLIKSGSVFDKSLELKSVKSAFLNSSIPIASVLNDTKIKSLKLLTADPKDLHNAFLNVEDSSVEAIIREASTLADIVLIDIGGCDLAYETALHSIRLANHVFCVVTPDADVILDTYKSFAFLRNFSMYSGTPYVIQNKVITDPIKPDVFKQNRMNWFADLPMDTDQMRLRYNNKLLMQSNLESLASSVFRDVIVALSSMIIKLTDARSYQGKTSAHNLKSSDMMSSESRHNMENMEETVRRTREQQDSRVVEINSQTVANAANAVADAGRGIISKVEQAAMDAHQKEADEKAAREAERNRLLKERKEREQLLKQLEQEKEARAADKRRNEEHLRRIEEERKQLSIEKKELVRAQEEAKQQLEQRHAEEILKMQDSIRKAEDKQKQLEEDKIRIQHDREAQAKKLEEDRIALMKEREAAVAHRTSIQDGSKIDMLTEQAVSERIFKQKELELQKSHELENAKLRADQDRIDSEQLAIQAQQKLAAKQRDRMDSERKDLLSRSNKVLEEANQRINAENERLENERKVRESLIEKQKIAEKRLEEKRNRTITEIDSIQDTLTKGSVVLPKSSRDPSELRSLDALGERMPKAGTPKKMDSKSKLQQSMSMMDFDSIFNED